MEDAGSASRECVRPTVSTETSKGTPASTKHVTKANTDEAEQRNARAHVKGLRDNTNMTATQTVETPKGIVAPTGKFKMFWDLATFFFVGFHLLVIPVELAFFEGVAVIVLSYIDIMIGVFFLLDLGINCRTAYLDTDGHVVSDQWKILKHYCCAFPCWFFLDAAAILPLVLTLIEVSSDSTSMSLARTGKLSRLFKHVRLLKLLRLLRVMRMPKLIQGFFDFISGRKRVVVLLKVIQQFLIICIVFHLVTCIWRASTDFPRHLQELQVDSEDDEFGTAYNFSLWWVVTMMVTGEGMSRPTTNGERLLWAAMGVMSVLLNNFSLAFLLELYHSWVEDQKMEYEKICIAQRFSNNNKLSWSLKLQLLSAIKAACSKHKELNEFESEIVPLLSQDLRQQIYGSVYDSYLSYFPPFVDGPPDVMSDFRHRLAANAKWKCYNTGDLIIEEGKHAKTMVIMLSGKGIFKSHKDPRSYIVKEKWWLGDEVCFWDSVKEPDSKPMRNGTIQALEPCTVLEISHAAFIEAVQACRLERWLNAQRNKFRQGEPCGCQICGNEDHCFKECPERGEIESSAFRRSSAMEDLELIQDEAISQFPSRANSDQEGETVFAPMATATTTNRRSRSTIVDRLLLRSRTEGDLPDTFAVGKMMTDSLREEITKELAPTHTKIDELCAELRSLALPQLGSLQTRLEPKLQEPSNGRPPRGGPIAGGSDRGSAASGAEADDWRIGSAEGKLAHRSGRMRTASCDTPEERTCSRRSPSMGLPLCCSGRGVLLDSLSQEWSRGQHILPESSRRYAAAGASELHL